MLFEKEEFEKERLLMENKQLITEVKILEEKLKQMEINNIRQKLTSEIADVVEVKEINTILSPKEKFIYDLYLEHKKHKKILKYCNCKESS